MDIINWLKNHKPPDYRLIIIFMLGLMLIRKEMMLFVIVLAGMSVYPNQIDYKPIMEKAGNTIGNAYEVGMTKLFEAGMRLGESTYPYNITILKLINYAIFFIAIIGVSYCVVLIVNYMMYKSK